MPCSDTAGETLLVALNTPPSSTGTYLNFTPVRASMRGITRWLRYAFGLPKSNRNSTLIAMIGSPGHLP